MTSPAEPLHTPSSRSGPESAAAPVLRRPRGSRALRAVLLLALPALLVSSHLAAQAPSARRPQPLDAEYTSRIRELLQDPRITTELVDHLPASKTVPSPLQFFGRVVGTPGELTYARDIHRYYEALDRASDRVALWRIGSSEEGRDMVLLAVADEDTIRQLDRFKAMLAALADPRRTTEQEARRLIGTAKPVYWIVSGLHSTENGGPEMFVELAYRLAVQETPLVQTVRQNVITLITPVLEVDGREKQVDTYYFNKRRREAGHKDTLPLMYWGKYVAHDNNRDGMGQFLALTKHVTRAFLEWKPTIMHDLHEASTYLYTSTGTGPYNEHIDPITIDEWWLLAKTEVLEMTKRGVPGVWTYGFYDGWVPNYLFFVAHAHNAVGRFYEVMGYGPENRTVTAQPTVTSREWFRPNPPLPTIQWGPRNNVNIQQSALLLALQHVARNRDVYLENFWLKNRRAVEKGRSGPVHGWVIPADQRRKAAAADAVNDLRRQGLEFHRASEPFTLGDLEVRQGDYIIRGDQPYRTVADMYFSVQNYAPSNPRPYDDTGWTFQYMRNLVIKPVADAALLDRAMTPIDADVKAPGGVVGSGPVLIVDHTTESSLVTFRFRHAAVPMRAAEEAFDAAGRRFRAGSFIVTDGDRAALDASLRALGLTAWAAADLPSVPAHDLDVPRIGYVHSWASTQNEGWVRAAFDTYGVPYTYFADTLLREGRLRERFDVIVYPHVGGTAQAQVNGISREGSAALPYQRSGETPNLGAQDQSADIRGGMGWEGLAQLTEFVRAGGTLITEGATSIILPEYNIVGGVTVERPQGLFVAGSVMRGVFADRQSPIAYGYDAQVPVYFNQDPVLDARGASGGGRGGGRGREPIPGVGMTVTPMAGANNRLSAYDPESPDTAPAPGLAAASPEAASTPVAAAGDTERAPRVVLEFPENPDHMLLSGVLVGGAALSRRAQVVDVPLGQGHVVSFAIRPFWRWQTHGTFFLAFNAILNWNDLDAGRQEASRTGP